MKKMNKINFYLFKLTTKYIILNICIITLFVIFINLIEISRILEKENQNIFFYAYLTFLKIPSIINQTIPFVIIISIAFLFRNLINNNELVSIRNVGLSIFDIFKPISLCIFFVGFLTLLIINIGLSNFDVFKPISLSIFFTGVIILLIINPLSANFEHKINETLNKKLSSIYSIKISKSGMWIKNQISKTKKNYINILNMDLKEMTANNIKILSIDEKNKYFISSKKGKIINQEFILKQVVIFDIITEEYNRIDSYNLNLNFSKHNIIDSIVNFKLIPFYYYFTHIKNLEKFNLHSAEISLFYISEILKPLFLIMLGFVVMGFSGKFKRNESFFKILFIAILIGFLIFILKEIITKLTISLNINFIIAYSVIFSVPFFIGLYQVIKIEND